MPNRKFAHTNIPTGKADKGRRRRRSIEEYLCISLKLLKHAKKLLFGNLPRFSIALEPSEIVPGKVNNNAIQNFQTP